MPYWEKKIRSEIPELRSVAVYSGGAKPFLVLLNVSNEAFELGNVRGITQL